MHTELGTGLVSTAPLIWNAISKIFRVGIVRNLGVIKKIKVDESSREKKLQASCSNYFFKGNAKSQK